MATIFSQWEQTGIYDPTNPLQQVKIQQTPTEGGYSSFYYNQVPPTGHLLGMGATATDWTPIIIHSTTGKLRGALGVSMPSWAPSALAVALGGIIGFFGTRWWERRRA